MCEPNMTIEDRMAKDVIEIASGFAGEGIAFRSTLLEVRQVADIVRSMELPTFVDDDLYEWLVDMAEEDSCASRA